MHTRIVITTTIDVDLDNDFSQDVSMDIAHPDGVLPTNVLLVVVNNALKASQDKVHAHPAFPAALAAATSTDDARG